MVSAICDGLGHTGRGTGDGAWIGAAVGAGVIVGLAVRIGKSVEEQRRYRSTVEGCVAARLAPAETGVHDSAR